MKLLLDTHVFIWWVSEPNKIPKNVVTYIQDPGNYVFLSTASSWEVQIKIGIGKISFLEPWELIVRREIEQNSLEMLSVLLEHTFALGKLPLIHRDPFDRILMAQALSEELTLVTNDSFIRQYPDIKTLWKN